MTDFGYGVDLSTSKVQWRAGYQKIVYEQAAKHEDLRVNWEDFCRDKDPSLPADEESIAEWVDTYEDDTGNWSGAEGLLAAIINLDKFDGEGIFAYEDQCLFVPARIPVDNADRLKWPTIREIQSILAEYLNPLLTEPVATEYLTIPMKIKRFKINDIERGRIAVADTFALRLRGLLGRDFRYFDALILLPCSEIHTCFMPYPIDVLFLSGSRQIIRIEENVPPWTLCAGEKGAWCVVELPAGRAGDWGLHDGDWVELF